VAKPRETDAQREWREAVEWIASDVRGRRFVARFIKPLLDQRGYMGDRESFEAGVLSLRADIMGAFAAQPSVSLIPLLTEMYREQDSRGRRADTDTSDGPGISIGPNLPAGYVAAGHVAPDDQWLDPVTGEPIT
jgi:hypothetical protein